MILFRLIFLRACKAAIAWGIRSSTSAYASGILVGVGGDVKVVGQKIDVLGYVSRPQFPLRYYKSKILVFAKTEGDKTSFCAS